jgi:hypothetical protein
LVIQVSDGASRVPNFCPAMKTTLGASGRASMASGSSKSARMTSIPIAASRAASSAFPHRETARMRRPSPSASAPRRSIAVSDGPIFPPAPTITTSPGASLSASITVDVG